ncbi:non-ribosomal peptide synthetase [Agrilutibacter solisilvae]|uniref:Amino acid adenylation domain-containing protein n=1 Tax=Agrilutibacter solisilvae TaxID=2763317 RepID=A0A974Y1C5_9GAMM|nr:non-ribosomal peptide synthetase [Lysobacter solisilvae]QSX79617.1 amino acid adenylation domain-containing protein [Lysobacter solisilvae]
MSDRNEALDALKRTILQNRMKQRMAQRAGEGSGQGIPLADRSAPIPLSWAQQRLWFLDQLDQAAGAAYHVSAALRLSGKLDRAALQASLDRIVARHENLRTCFASVDGTPRQVIAPENVGFTMVEQDVSALDARAQAEALADITAREAGAPFDLATGPLIRGRLLRLSEQEHVMLVTQHHIISDGWSNGVLVREVSALYTAFSQGQPDPLPPLQIQYADYAAWQRQWLQGDVLRRQLDFWRDHLGGAPALLELPIDRPRPPVQGYAGDFVEVDLSDELSAGLRALSQRHGVTMFMTLLAAWSVLLSRLSGQDDIVVGSPVSNRPRSEVEPLIGFFVNTLALRVDLSDQPTVAGLLARIKATLVAAYAHQDLPFEQVVEALQPERNLSYSPVFQVLLSMNSTVGADALKLPGLELAPIATPQVSSHFDLDLGFADSGTGLIGKLTYSTELFDRASVVRFTEYLVAVLREMVSDDTQHVSRLSLLSTAERDQVVHGFNATQSPYPQDALIHTLFEAQAAQQPQADAVEYDGVRLSYGELNRRANQVAHRLIALGVKPDDRVAICTERSLDMVVGLLGILKAGGAYVPLDPAYPVDRLAYMLADSAPMAVLTQAVLRDELPMLTAAGCPLLVLDRDFADAAEPASNPALPLSPRQLAYVIYTSGSTGQPKGVMVEHGSAVNFWQVMGRTTHRTCAPNSRVALNAAFSFDMSLKGLLQLLSGHCLVLIPQAIRASGPALLGFLEQQRIDALDSTPSQLEGLLAAGLLEPTGYRPRNVLLGGEPIGPVMWERLKASPVVCFHNMYGPTEATVDATIQCIADSRGGPVIGKPLGNARIYLLDGQGQPVPVGVAGEIHIGGVGVARGYLHRAELTAERFLADPFAGTPDARMYKTGDLGRWLPDGNLEYLGRNDFQVKIRGFRIELGEIEAKLRACAGVREAVVIAREDTPGDQRLVAYAVADDGVELSVPQLREALAQELPEHMIPSAFVSLAAMPLTPNGKLDRRALPSPDQNAVASRAYEAPLGEVEQAMAAIWQELLGLDRVGRHDHFFELGGHSLLVISLIERMRQRDLAVDARTVFMTPVLSAIAAQLTPAGPSVAHEVVVPNPITPDTTTLTPDMLPLVRLTQGEIDRIVAGVPGGVANVQDIYPLAPLQEGILFHHLLDGDSEGDTYLLSSVLAFDERHRLDGFLAALQQVIDRHDLLRTAVHWQDVGTPVQVVYRDAVLPVTELALSAQEPALPQLLARTSPRRLRLDLQRAPILAAYTAQDPDSGQWLLALLNHHMVCDHIAQEVLLSEIRTLLQGQGATLGAPVPYRNFVARGLQVPQADHETYFREQLGDVDEPTAPFGLLDVQGDGGELDEARVRLDDLLAQRIRDSARQHGVTPAVLFHVAWAQVLAQCSGRDDVVFGTVLTGRLQDAGSTDQVVGMFINTLPIRIPLAQVRVADAVRDTGRRLGELLAHEQAPLALAQRCSGIRAPLPLFTSLLNYRHSHEASSAEERAYLLSAWEGVQLLSGQARSNFPISVSIDDLGQGFGLSISALPGPGAVRLAGYMERVLRGLADDLQGQGRRQLRSLAMLPHAERDQLLREFNSDPVDFPQQALLQEVFEALAARQPEAPAVESGGQCLDYGTLNRHANALAHRLIECGVRPRDRVAICAGRSLDMVVAMLATLKAGAAYVPIDPEYPAERVACMLTDSEPAVLLAPRDLHERLAVLASSSCPVLALDEADMSSQTTSNPQVAGLCSRDPACVIYTSGSTGQPKGVLVEHRGILRLVINGTAQLQSGDVLAHCSNPSFDASTWEIWGALLNGARLVIVPSAVVMDPVAFNRALVEARVNVAFLTVGLFNEYADALVEAFAGLRMLLTGGDVMDPRSALRVLGLMQPAARLLNVYGPTEATTYATSFDVDTAVDPIRPVPIGRPVPNTRVYILGSGGEPVPVGVPGEIHIGGPGVAGGYLHRPVLTAERFVIDPFTDVADATMYRTGDLGRWRTDGQIEFIGRNDAQVKIRGFRVEPGEIEALVRTCEGVREAVVIALPDAGGDKRLVGYVVWEADAAEKSTSRLREQVAKILPGHMVPAAFVSLAALPLTPNGKLDRKALPAPDQDSLADGAYEAPRDGIEQVVAGIWQDLLGLERVGRHDNFFELGGHSLLAVRLVTRLRATLGVEITLRDLFARPSLSSLALAVARACPSSHAAIVPVDRGQPLPLSWAQQRLWFVDQLDHAAGGTYHIPAALRLSGSLDRAALQASLDRIVARHESLRTTFVAGLDGEPQQVIAPAAMGFTLLEHDLRGIDHATQDVAIAELTVSESRAPFDLATGPLIRGRLLRLAEHEHILLVTQHHIISDGWSVSVMVRELSTLYAAFQRGQPDPLAPLPIQYADFAAWQRGWLQGERLQAQIDFWRDHLSGAPALLELPTDRPRPPVQSYRGDRVDVCIPPDLAQAMRGLAQRHGVTLFLVVQAAWAILLSRLSGQSEVVIGSPMANRQRAELEPLIGFFVNTLALRVDVPGDTSVGQLLARSKAALLGAFAHQDLPFEQVVEALQPERNLSHSPVFQVWLNLNAAAAAGDGQLHLPGLTLSPVDIEQQTARVDLSLALTDLAGDGLAGSLVYAVDLFDRTTAERIAGHLTTLLQAMVSDDTQRVSRLPLLSTAERDQVVHGFNATQSPYPQDALIHTLFEAQAAQQPQADAVEYDGVRLSYGELNRRANQVAHRLIALGVKPDDRVAICTERSLDMVVGLLGILKAGGAYVPLDPAYPVDRLAYMLADSAPMAVLTQAVLRDELPMLTAAGCPLLVLDRDFADAAEPASNPALPLSPRQLAYVIYTSGSTGQPKGVMVEHRSAVNFWQVMGRTTHRTCAPNSRVALNAAFSFDMSLKGLLQLLSGHCLVLIPQAIRASGPALLGFLEQQRIDALDSTPSQLEGLLAAGLLEPTGYRPRNVLLGGEPIGPVMWERLKASPVVCFHNMYGPTEATVDATIQCIADSRGGPVIGKPLGNARIYLLDGQGQPVPVGVAGEIHIGGVGVARGYLHRAELTAERFLADPFAGTPDARMYKTGDLGRWLPDGNLEYLGRNDFQVKIRGFRIELGEIEAKLRSCAGVREAVVIAREDTPGDQRLVAYAVADDGVELSVPQLREALAQELPEHMIPSAFVSLAAMPLTPNGKLDRRALPSPDQNAVASRAYEAPLGEVEQAMAAIWQELLGLDRVGRHDHFFELGGHSLLVMQLVIRIREQLQVDVPLRALFEQPVFSALCESVVAEQLKRFATSDVAAVEDELSDLTEEELLAMLSGASHER